ncbi:MAG: glutathione S-transferase N-terminal domain-containing protein [Planctomycetota bacterium]
MTTTLTLSVGNKNYSSWSMRPFVLMREVGIEFELHQIWLDEDKDRATRRQLSGMGTVPVLTIERGGERTVMPDTLAMTEVLHELFRAAGIWPADFRKRCQARALCAEMHAGFQALRSEMPMNWWRKATRRSPGSEGLERDLARVDEIFAAAEGPLLLGAFSAADAFFAPVASRLRSYEVTLGPRAERTVDALLALPSVLEWGRDGAAEERRFESYDAL